MPIARRDLFSLLPATFAQSGMFACLLGAAPAAGKLSAPSAPLPSAVYPFDSLPVRASHTAEMRPILNGRLATGESIEVHETTLLPGGAPHPPHHHEHSEMWLIREGLVEITMEGKPHRLGSGSLAFVRSNEEHGITNPGDGPATYFVVAIGPGADRG
jgi:mannose-6-phosphate isomerase-like protein (cupin superfamily)